MKGSFFHKLTTDKLEILRATLVRVDSFMVFAIFLIVFMANVTANCWLGCKWIRPKNVACEQALLFDLFRQAKRASRECTSEGPRKGRCPSRLCRSLARSRETRFTRPNRRACSQAIKMQYVLKSSSFNNSYNYLNRLPRIKISHLIIIIINMIVCIIFTC